MKLITLHRILVSTAIAFCGWFLWQQLLLWKSGGGARALVIAIAAAAVALGLAWYLANLRRFVRLEPRREPREP